jgi:hypothetical protein
MPKIITSAVTTVATAEFTTSPVTTYQNRNTIAGGARNAAYFTVSYLIFSHPGRSGLFSFGYGRDILFYLRYLEMEIAFRTVEPLRLNAVNIPMPFLPDIKIRRAPWTVGIGASLVLQSH